MNPHIIYIDEDGNSHIFEQFILLGRNPVTSDNDSPGDFYCELTDMPRETVLKMIVATQKNLITITKDLYYQTTISDN